GADATLACRETDDVAVGQTRIALDGEHRVRSIHLPHEPGGQGEICASIEVVIFSKALLLELLEQGRAHVGQGLVYDLLQSKTSRYRVLGYGFGGRAGRVTQDRYWRSLESLDAYYQANMDLLQPFSPMDLYQSDWPIRTYHAQHPPARTVPGKSSNEGVFVNSIAGSGTVIAGGGVSHSVLFPSVFVDDAATVEDSILFSGVRVGEGAQLRHCLIDKEVRIPAGERIGYDRELDAKRFTVSEQGIIVVPKAYTFDYP
ncbi:MAG: glucose-1-phosphate adenylyltransferase, partial [Gammaproteobacteria bacterium]